MREILFRAKAINRDPDREYRTDYKNGDWVYGLVSKLYDEGFYKKYSKYSYFPATMTNEDGVTNIDVDYKTIGQFTGLADKNGKKIFEGDIIRHHYKNLASNGYTSDKGVVKWDCKECFFYRTSLSGKDKTISVDCIYEVIGNIYDNPELMEKE